MKPIAVAILNWNGIELLKRFLPLVIEHSSALATIYVIDNASSDDSVSWVLEHYPDVKTIELNVGYIDPDNVPDEIIQSALQMIKVFYYESEKQVNSTLIPESVKMTLDSLRRFI